MMIGLFYICKISIVPMIFEEGQISILIKHGKLLKS